MNSTKDPEIAPEDLEGFKGIRKGLGEQTESNVQLDVDDNEESKEEDSPKIQRQESYASGDYEQENADE